MAEAEIRGGRVETSKHPLWHIVAAFAAVLPAAGPVLATRGVIHAFRGMAETGSGGIGAVSMGMYEANRPLIVAALAAAVLAGSLAVVVLRKPQAFPGLALSLVPLLACVPALLLWFTEGFIVDVLAGDETGPVGEISQRVATLLIASAGGAVLLIAVAFAALGISLARPRSGDPALPPVAVWTAMAVLLLGLAVLFYVRASFFYKAAFTGHF